ncbi:MAG: hypothetical protein WAT78_02045 [Rhizobiaceae bacterium]
MTHEILNMFYDAETGPLLGFFRLANHEQGKCGGNLVAGQIPDRQPV